MPNLRPDKPRDVRRTPPAAYPCRRCGQRLTLVKSRTSPARLGPPLTTETYECQACDTGYLFTPATGRWKPWAMDGD